MENWVSLEMIIKIILFFIVINFILTIITKCMLIIRNFLKLLKKNIKSN